MNIELAVFDMAGTTISDNGEIAAAFQTALKYFGYDVPKEAINTVMGSHQRSRSSATPPHEAMGERTSGGG